MWCKALGLKISQILGFLTIVAGAGCSTSSSSASGGQEAAALSKPSAEPGVLDSPGNTGAARPAGEGRVAAPPAEAAPPAVSHSAATNGSTPATPDVAAQTDAKTDAKTDATKTDAKTDAKNIALGDEGDRAKEIVDLEGAKTAEHGADDVAEDGAKHGAKHGAADGAEDGEKDRAEDGASKDGSLAATKPVGDTPPSNDATGRDSTGNEISKQTADTDEAAVDSTATVDGEAAADQAPYDVIVQQTEVDTVLHVKPLGQALPHVEYRPDSRALQLHFDPVRPRGEQSDELSGMLKQLAEELQAALLPSEMRLSGTTEAYPEFAARLAERAAKDPDWRKVQRDLAKLKDGEQDDTLQDYAINVGQSEPLAAELDQVFGPLGLRVELAGVSKCSLLKPTDRFLREHKVRTAIKVPAGCEQLQFRFKQLGTNGEELSEVETAEEAAL